MSSLIHSTTGMVHFIFSVLSMILGAVVLYMLKGNTLHKRIGYAYFICMIGVNITSFMIYRLFDGFGIFHIMAVISSISLIGGMIPAIVRKPKNDWVQIHFSFMYWSVVGLYAAFISEVMTRMPNPSRLAFMGSLFIFFGISTYYFNKYTKVWKGLSPNIRS